MSRNTELIAIADKIGVEQEYNPNSRNSILDAIAITYGVNVQKKAMNNLLYGIDSILRLQYMPRVSRNEHIKSIAEFLGATTLTENQSRNFYLSKWLEFASPIGGNQQFPAGTWDTSLNLDYTKVWNMGV